MDDFSAGVRAFGRLTKPHDVDGRTVKGISLFESGDSALLHALQNPRVNIAGIRRGDLLPVLGMFFPIRVIKRVAGTYRYFLTKAGRAAAAAASELASDVILGAIGIQRCLGAVEHRQQLGLVSMQPTTRPGQSDSEQCEQLGEISLVLTGPHELAGQGPLGGVLLHDVKGHVVEHGKIVRAVIHTGSVLVLVHDDVEAPLQSVLDAPIGAYDVVEAFPGQRRALEIIGHFGGGLAGGFSGSDHFVDRREAGPVMVLLQPVDLGCHRGRAGLDAAMIAVHRGVDGVDLARWVVEKPDYVVVQRTLVPPQRQHVIADLRDDLPGDVAQAVERIDGDDGVLERQYLQQLRHGGDLVGLYPRLRRGRLW